MSGDGDVVHPEHSKVVDRMIATAGVESTPFPVRFVLQSGDAVLRGQNGAMFNVSFTPIIERLTRGANISVLLLGRQPRRATAARRSRPRPGLHNTLTAMSKLIPPEGSPRRLNGY